MNLDDVNGTNFLHYNVFHPINCDFFHLGYISVYLCNNGYCEELLSDAQVGFTNHPMEEHEERRQTYNMYNRSIALHNDFL